MHTPGPWEYGQRLSPSENHRGWFVRTMAVGAGGLTFAWEVSPLLRRDGDDPPPEAIANARLIASAPELLEALKAMEPLYGHAWDTTEGDVIITGDSIDKFEAAFEKCRSAIAKAEGK